MEIRLKYIITSVILITSCNSKMVKNKASTGSQKDKVIETINMVNTYWQTNNPKPENSFWHRVAYHIGNIADYEVTRNKSYLAFSEAWAEHNKWMGAQSQNKSEWRYSYRESDNYVLFGDFQI